MISLNSIDENTDIGKYAAYDYKKSIDNHSLELQV